MGRAKSPRRGRRVYSRCGVIGGCGVPAADCCGQGSPRRGRRVYSSWRRQKPATRTSRLRQMRR
ncbi:MAG: hypothetical protein WCI95_12875, partial [bacterium]